MGDSAELILSVVDCIVRASNSGGSVADEALAAELTKKFARLCESFSNDTLLSDADGCKLVDQDAELLENNAKSISLDNLLARLSSFGQQSDHFQTVRDAAHFALGYRDLQRQFAERLQSIKTQAIYNFAYGLSHELNNPLANIASRAGLLQQKLAGDKTGEALSQAIIDNAMRGGEMLGDLMLIARPPIPELRAIDLGELAQQLNTCGNHWSIPLGIRCRVLATQPGAFKTDPGMLLEILWCLLRNALEASSSGDEVLIDLKVSDGMFFVRISDDGPGLSPQALENCCDPYYSGREAGRGLGLGLAKARRFASLLGGTIDIRNRPGKGCEALLRLPVGIDQRP